jgi:uridylate kinase
MQLPNRILLKLTGTVFGNSKTSQCDVAVVRHLVDQIKQLIPQYQFGIVIGGGNLFRGNIQGKMLGLSSWAAHTTGMLATLMNGVMLADLFAQAEIPATLVSALDCPGIAAAINQQTIREALKTSACIIFAGGTGNPYFTTDTNAVLRCLQMGASELWKGTDVDGVYDEDPRKNPNATLLNNVSYDYVLCKRLGIMDSSAFTLASDHRLTIKIFNIFESNALIKVIHEPNFSTVINP